jgi:purine-binding chemotaxis protein CheW
MSSAAISTDSGAISTSVRRAVQQAVQLEAQQFLTFIISGESYGIGILHIKEILEYGNVTPVPMMPNFIAGVINLRGSVVPVIDMANRFQVSPVAIDKKTSVIVVEVNDGDETLEVGIMVDRVNEVLELKTEMISPAPKFGASIRTDFIQSMGKLDNKQFIILLDVDRVLSIDEMSIIKQVEEMQPEDLALLEVSDH